MAAAGDVGAGNNYTSFDSIILSAKGKGHQYAILGQAMRKAGAVWNNYSIVIRRAQKDCSVVVFLTLDIEYNFTTIVNCAIRYLSGGIALYDCALIIYKKTSLLGIFIT